MTHIRTSIARSAICSRNSQVLILMLIIVLLLAAQPHSLAESLKQQPTAKFISRGELRDVVYSPDGTQLAAMTLEGLWLYGEDHPEGQLLYEEHASPLSAVAWSPDGSIIALGTRDGNVRLLNSLDGQLLGTLEYLHQ